MSHAIDPKTHSLSHVYTTFFLCLVGFLDYFALTAPVPLFLEMIPDPNNLFLGSQSSETLRGLLLGIMIAVPPATQALFSPIIGRLSDVKGRKYTLLVGIGLLIMGNAFGFVALAYRSLILLFLSRILFGFCLTNVPILQAAMSDLGEEGRMTRFSYLNAAFGLGIALGPLFGASIIEWYNEHLSNYILFYIINFLFAFVSFGVVFFKMPQLQMHPQEDKKDLPFPRIATLFLITIFSFCFGWCFWNEFIPVYYKHTLHLSVKNMGFFLASKGCWFFTASMLLPWIIRKFSLEKLLAWSLLFHALCAITSLIVPSFFLLMVHTSLMQLANALVMTLSMAFMAKYCSQTIQGRAQGLFIAVYAWGSSIASLIFGPFIISHPEWCPVISAVGIFISFVLYRYMVLSKTQALPSP